LRFRERKEKKKDKKKDKDKEKESSKKKQDGEMTVEETNKLRASLGLAPLKK